MHHTFRHAEQLGLDRVAVATAIQADLARQGPVSPGANITGNVSVGGVTLEYRALVSLKALSISVESRVLETSDWRKLRKEEADLIAAMVRNSPEANAILRPLPERLMKEMKDSGMGSLRFKDTNNRERRFGKKIAEAEFLDEDGVPVSVVVNLDNSDELLELDIWKVDFSPLKRYPRPEELRMKAPT